MESLGKVTFAVIAIVLGTLISGYVLTVLWDWFISDTFGIKRITIQQAIGIDLIKNYFLYHISSKIKSEKTTKGFGESLFYAIIESLFIALFFLGIGYFIHSF